MTSTGLSSSRAAPDVASATGALMIGLLSYQDAETIGLVTKAAREGLACHFEGLVRQLVLADCGSTDNTTARAREAVEGTDGFLELSVPRAAVDMLELPYHGVPGKARALQCILMKARELQVRACV